MMTTDINQNSDSGVMPQMIALAEMFGAETGYVGSGDNNNITTTRNNNNNNDNNNNNNNNNNEQADDFQQSLMFQNGSLQSGPLEALIQHLVPTADYYPDRTYSFTFLLTSRLFIRPHELLAQVSKLCIVQESLSARDADDVISKLGGLNKFGRHIVSLLSEWTEMFPYDFRDERMMKQLREITQIIIATLPELRKDINNLSYNLVTKLTNLKSYEENLNQLDEEEKRKTETLTDPIVLTDMIEMCPSPLSLAEQLTHIELDRLSMVGPEEFVQAFSKEQFNKELNDVDSKTIHNLEAYVQWFNKLTSFVASEITSHIKKKSRVRMIEYFMDVAKECINIGNFNSLMAIVAGLSQGPVTRLKKTWAKVNTEKFHVLEREMDPSNNFGSYRSRLKAALWRSEGTTDDKKRIVIPFFSLFVKDLYFLNEGCDSVMEDGNVNFQKCWQMAKQISDLIAWQRVQCPFERKDSIINYILTKPVYKESNWRFRHRLYDYMVPTTNGPPLSPTRVSPSRPSATHPPPQQHRQLPHRHYHLHQQHQHHHCQRHPSVLHTSPTSTVCSQRMCSPHPVRSGQYPARKFQFHHRYLLISKRHKRDRLYKSPIYYYPT